MTKKHYIAVANGFAARLKVLNERHNQGEDKTEAFEIRYHETLRCVHMFADVAKADNARFDRERFLVACGF